MLIFFVAVLIRVAHFAYITNSAFPALTFKMEESDMYGFWEWRGEILQGDLLGRETHHPQFEWMTEIAPPETWHAWWGGKTIFHQAPLYPYFLAALSLLLGGSLSSILMFQLLLGAVQPLILYGLGERLSGKRVGLIAGLLGALYGPFVFYQGVLLRDFLPPILEPLLLLLLLRALDVRQSKDWVWAGLVFGLAVLTKPTVMIFLPGIILWLIVKLRKETGGVLILFGLGGLIALTPLMVRNVVVGAPLTAISNRALEGFIEGNAADGYPVGLVHPPSMQKILDKANGSLTTVMKETIKTYDGNTVAFMERIWLKIRVLLDPLEVPNNVAFDYGREISPVLNLLLRFGWVIPFGLFGLLIAVQDVRRHGLLILYVVLVSGGLLAVNMMSRYRLGIVAIGLVYAAVAIDRILVRSSENRPNQVFVGLFMVGALVLLVNVVIPVEDVRKLKMLMVHPSGYFISSEIYAEKGEFDPAIEEIRRFGRNAERNGFENLVSIAHSAEGDLRIRYAAYLLYKLKNFEGAFTQAELAEKAYAEHMNKQKPNLRLAFIWADLGEESKAKLFLTVCMKLGPETPLGIQAANILKHLKRIHSDLL